MKVYPYYLLKRQNPPKRKYSRDISKFSGYSGYIHCEMICYTPFETKGVAEVDRKPVNFSEYPVIPGASIKGAIRSLTEFIGEGCSVTESQKNSLWYKCTDNKKRCSACTLYGMIGGRENLLRGSVRFSNAKPFIIDDNLSYKKMAPVSVLLMGPNPKNKNYKIKNTEYIQKFYFHHYKAKKIKPSTNKRASTLYPVEPGSRFEFTVKFDNLDPELLALLLYSLFLEPGLMHKMGRGKPAGLGSVKIVPKSYYIENPKEYYLSGKKDKLIEVANPMDIREFYDSVKPYVGDKIERKFLNNSQLNDLKRILSYQPLELEFGWTDCSMISYSDYLETVPIGKEDPSPPPLQTTPLSKNKFFRDPNTSMEDLWKPSAPELQKLWEKAPKEFKNLWDNLVKEKEFQKNQKDKFEKYNQKYRELLQKTDEESSNLLKVFDAAFREIIKSEKEWKDYKKEYLLPQDSQTELPDDPIERLEYYDDNQLKSKAIDFVLNEVKKLKKGKKKKTELTEDKVFEYVKKLKELLIKKGIWNSLKKRRRSDIEKVYNEYRSKSKK